MVHVEHMWLNLIGFSRKLNLSKPVSFNSPLNDSYNTIQYNIFINVNICVSNQNVKQCLSFELRTFQGQFSGNEKSESNYLFYY